MSSPSPTAFLRTNLLREASPPQIFSDDGRNSPTTETIAFLQAHPETVNTATIADILKRHKDVVLDQVTTNHRKALDDAFQKGQETGKKLARDAEEESEKAYSDGLIAGRTECEQTHKETNLRLLREGKQTGRAACEETHPQIHADAKAECAKTHEILERTAFNRGERHCTNNHERLIEKAFTQRQKVMRSVETQTDPTPTSAVTPTDTKIAAVAQPAVSSLGTTFAKLVAGLVIGAVIVVNFVR